MSEPILDLAGLTPQQISKVKQFVSNMKCLDSGLGPNGLPLDPLINPTGVDSDRFVLFPIKHADIWRAYKKASQAYWVTEEIRNLQGDVDDFENKLTDNQRYFVKMVLAFFASSDGIVNENLLSRFATEVQYPEARQFYGLQAQIENIHCVSGDTHILTSEGHKTIETLVDQEVEVWNGEQFSKTTVRRTSEKAMFTAVRLSNGVTLHCTSQHRWFLEGSENAVFTQDLRIGDKLKHYELPFISNLSENRLESPELHGLLLAKGKFNYAHHYGKEVGTRKPYIVRLTRDDMRRAVGSEHLLVVELSGFYANFPTHFDEATRLGFLRGLLCGPRTFATNDAVALHLPIPRRFAKTISDEAHAFFATLGIHCETRVVYDREKGNVVVYLDKEELLRAPFAHVRDLWETLPVTEDAPVIPRKRAVDVYVTGTKLALPGPSYCFCEPLRGAGTFNCVVTGNSESYSIMIQELVRDPEERTRLFTALETVPSIRKKGDWALRWIEDSESLFGTRLFAFMVVEGLFFAGSFACIQLMNSQGLMPALSFLNQKISVDELSHAAFAAMLYKDHLTNQKPSEELGLSIMKEAVEIEIEFQTTALPCRLIGMNADSMAQYIRHVADTLLVQCGLPRLYHANNPFPFMQMLYVASSTNFFERTNANYNIASVDRKFLIHEDF
jgi:ribonucleotide reductase beta subunit family protein with ferritin-like domain